MSTLRFIISSNKQTRQSRLVIMKDDSVVPQVRIEKRLDPVTKKMTETTITEDVQNTVYDPTAIIDAYIKREVAKANRENTPLGFDTVELPAFIMAGLRRVPQYHEITERMQAETDPNEKARLSEERRELWVTTALTLLYQTLTTLDIFYASYPATYQNMLPAKGGERNQQTPGFLQIKEYMERMKNTPKLGTKLSNLDTEHDS